MAKSQASGTGKTPVQKGLAATRRGADRITGGARQSGGTSKK